MNKFFFRVFLVDMKNKRISSIHINPRVPLEPVRNILIINNINSGNSLKIFISFFLKSKHGKGITVTKSNP